MKNTKPFPLLVYLSYTVGLIVGLFLLVIAAWADMESSFYGFSRLAEAGLRGFGCPVLMTRGETASISLTISNTTDNPISPAARVEISTPLLTQEYTENLKLAPGESQRLEWPVGPENIDLKRFIFAKALVFSVFPRPNQESTCGIFIVDLPGSGRVILPALIALSLLGMGFGLYGMSKLGASTESVEKYVRPLLFLSMVIILGFAASFIGNWVLSVLLLAVALLLIVILSGLLLLGERKKH